VLDNADDPAVDYQHYFPDGSLGVVLMTSRNPECQQYATVKSIPLEGLSNKDAEKLLLRAASVPQAQYSVHAKEAAEVANLLRSHPLALIQAGAYVSRGHCTLSEYRKVFEQHRERLLAFHSVQGQSRYRDVYTTFEASAEILQSSQAEAEVDALQLLPVLATCGPNRLPLALFEEGWKRARSVPTSTADNNLYARTTWHVSHLLPLIQADSDRWDSFRLIEAIRMLKTLSLVSTDDFDGVLSVSMHPLIHAWARDRQNMTEQHNSWIATGCLFAMLDSDSKFWLQNRWQLQPHIQALTIWNISKMFVSEPSMKVTTIIVRCGWLLLDMRDDAKLFDLMNRLMRQLGLDPCTVHRKWSDVYKLTARNFYNMDRPQETLSLLEQMVKTQEQTLAEDDSDLLTSQHELAGAYLQNGQVKKAVALLEHVVKIREQALTEDHTDRLASQHELAGAYLANGQVKVAVSLLEHVVKIREQLAEDYLDRLVSEHTLAGVYLDNGQVKESVTLLEHVVRIQEQVLAEDHPSQLTSQHELARAYLKNGQIREAVSLLEHVVKIQEQLAEDHPDRLVSQHELARAYKANGQIKEAALLLEHVVKMEEQWAEDHPSRLTSEHVLATMYWDCGRRNCALQMMRHVVEIRRAVLDEHHPHRIGSEGELEYMERKMNEENRKEEGKEKEEAEAKEAEEDEMGKENEEQEAEEGRRKKRRKDEDTAYSFA
jgi:tetratricopeptide (TPR) repeat protein